MSPTISSLDLVICISTSNIGNPFHLEHIVLASVSDSNTEAACPKKKAQASSSTKKSAAEKAKEAKATNDALKLLKAHHVASKTKVPHGLTEIQDEESEVE
ncbi:hypothetical protein B0H11DRAFT_1944236 [Mycena galericulata]|nr:hypothetical protein B0H11DRAFT_1944236 [Mycena galericulata]